MERLANGAKNLHLVNPMRRKKPTKNCPITSREGEPVEKDEIEENTGSAVAGLKLGSAKKKKTTREF